MHDRVHTEFYLGIDEVYASTDIVTGLYWNVMLIWAI